MKSALQHRDLRFVFAALAIAISGGWAFNVALLVFVFEQTHSAVWVAAATAGRFVPALIFGPYGGVLAERFERVRLMVRLDLISSGCMAALFAAAALDGPAWLVIGIGAVSAVVGVTYEPAAAALTPQLVPEGSLAGANALRSLIDNLAVILGPGIGAVVVAVGGVRACFLFATATFLCSAALVWRVQTRSRPVDVTEGGQAGVWRQVMIGFRTIAGHPRARVLVTFSVLASFVYGTDTVLFVELSTQRLGVGGNGFGYLMAGLGVGGIMASFAVPRLASRAALAPVIVAGLAAYCLPTLLMIEISQLPTAVIVQVVRGAGTIVVDVLAVTALQRSLPGDVLARVFGAYFSLVIAAISVGSFTVPFLTHTLGIDGTLVAVGLVPALLGLLGMPALRRMDDDNAAQVVRIRGAVDLLRRTELLDGASEALLERLAASAARIEVDPGTVVIRQGDIADALYVIESGRCAVTIAEATQTTAPQPPDLTSGDVLGEIGLLRRVPRTATVRATESTTLLKIDGDEFLAAVEDTGIHPTLREVTRTRLARSAAATRSTSLNQ